MFGLSKSKLDVRGVVTALAFLGRFPRGSLGTCIMLVLIPAEYQGDTVSATISLPKQRPPFATGTSGTLRRAI
jgi:hypothetical protein